MELRISPDTSRLRMLVETDFTIKPPHFSPHSKDEGDGEALFAGTSPGGLDGLISRRMADSISAPATLETVAPQHDEAGVVVADHCEKEIRANLEIKDLVRGVLARLAKDGTLSVIPNSASAPLLFNEGVERGL